MQLLMDDFARVLADSGAEAIFLLPVYAAGEAPLPGADAAALAERIRARGHRCVEALSGRMEAAERLARWARPGDTILTQGAGDVTAAGAEILARLPA
jgi:UDP-N-acetylmuramate--alanine ligase